MCLKDCVVYVFLFLSNHHSVHPLQVGLFLPEIELMAIPGRGVKDKGFSLTPGIKTQSRGCAHSFTPVDKGVVWTTEEIDLLPQAFADLLPAIYTSEFSRCLSSGDDVQALRDRVETDRVKPRG